MTRRTYGQFCAVAKALDLVGERWTLLIVRELLPGPRRFTDLLTALPGLGTNLLTDRLKQLEAAAIVTRDRLPPPAATSVYLLTGRGYGLGPVVSALAAWGDTLLGTPTADEAFRPHWAALKRAVAAHPAPDVREMYQLQVDDEVLHIRVADGRAMAHYGAAPVPPDVMIHADQTAFLDVVLHGVELAHLAATGRIRVEATPAALGRAAQILHPAEENPR